MEWIRIFGGKTISRLNSFDWTIPNNITGISPAAGMIGRPDAGREDPSTSQFKDRPGYLADQQETFASMPKRAWVRVRKLLVEMVFPVRSWPRVSPRIAAVGEKSVSIFQMASVLVTVAT
jgi:hypothetical protein